MDELDRYLKLEYKDIEYQRYRIVRRQLAVWRVKKAVSLVCLEGSVWLTRTGDPKDYLLGRGESMILKPGKWILQSLDEARVEKNIISATQEVRHGQAVVFPVLQRV